MLNLFSMDGLIYKVSIVIYNLLVLNFLWLIFSIPIITIGGSTTALFYVVGKIIRGENYKLLSDFWKSFKLNIRQATVIWVILFLGIYIIITNVIVVNALVLSKFFLYMQYIILFELLVTGIYIFPLLSRYHMSIFHSFKMAIFIGNRHFITSILSLMVFPGIYYLISWKSFFIIFLMAIYAFWISYLVKDKFKLYTE